MQAEDRRPEAIPTEQNDQGEQAKCPGDTEDTKENKGSDRAHALCIKRQVTDNSRQIIHDYFPFRASSAHSSFATQR
jgi:hypothetical protein